MIAPYLVGVLKDNTTKKSGFFWPLLLLAFFAFIGFLVNIWLYVDDI